MSEFTGTERFEVRRRLGSGGMGVVYLVHDRERGVDVALKFLARVDARGIAGLKNEFRALAGLRHPNLVELHELFCDEGRWFFTMEVVEGQSFRDHVRAPAGQLDEPTALVTVTSHPMDLITTVASRRADTPSPSAPVEAPRPQGLACSLARLAPALRQLAEAVHFIHGAGKLHRDLKPSNVLVTEEGRVKILDFGLAVLQGERRGETRSAPRGLEGTPAFMAPEQTIGGVAGPASDWYAFGVMLYDALTGRLPFTGDIRQMLAQKRVIEPVAPRVIAGDRVPVDLDRLCVDLLRMAPDRRPSGAEVLRRLGVQPSSLSAPRPAAPLFVGRERQLAALHRAFAETRRGRAVTVHLHGRSGMGKSALGEHFLDAVWKDEHALVLSGRCYERESVPYKAWDSLVDALARHLSRLPHGEAEQLLPDDLSDLARVFPVLLEQVRMLDERSEPRDSSQGGIESRRRAFGALREIFRRLAKSRPLVLHLDDLQWGDVDSAKLFAAVLAPPDPPPLLLISSYRTEEASESEFFRELGAREVISVEVDRLEASEAEALALSLLGDDRARPLARAIARESEGSPFFVAELVRSVLEEGADTSVGRTFEGVSLDGLLRDRVGRLSPEARRLLEILSIASRPIEQGVCARAAEVPSPDDALAALRAASLIRSRGLRPRDLAEPYHDRVREVVGRTLEGEALRGAHGRLALALEASGTADADVLAAHFEGAGDRGRAAVYAVRAAEHAKGALAFDRAAKLYRLALSLGAGEGDMGVRRELSIALADALVNAGRGAEAAPVFLDVAADAPPRHATELRRRAAEQFLVSGHIDRGSEVLRGVLDAVGVRYPETAAGATLAFLGRQAMLRVRGTHFLERRAQDLDAETLARIDACFSAGKGLALVDPVRGLGFLAQHLLLSLEAGDPRRVCAGLSFHAITVSMEGGAVAERARTLIDQAWAIAERLRDPYLLGVVGGCTAASYMCLGRWRETVEESARSVDLLRREHSGAAWEIEGSVVCSEVSLLWMGRLAELAVFVQDHVRDAHDRGDLFAATYARMHTWYAPIAADDPKRAHAEMREAMARWSKGGFHVIHLWALYGEASYDLYAGDARGARARLARGWADLKASNILRVQFQRVMMLMLRGATTLAAAREVRGRDRAELLAAADRDATALSGEGMAYARPGAALLRAGIEVTRGRREEALPDLDAAIAGFDAADMRLHAACARRRRGELLGGDEGARLIEGADAALCGEGIARPDRWTAMIAPGF